MALKQDVQQQNRHAFETMLEIARRYRQQGLPTGVTQFLAEQQIDASAAALVRAESADYMLGFHGLAGLLVTAGQRFFEFELELDGTGMQVVQGHQFMDVTAGQNVSLHNRGRGLGDGALALQVLAALAGHPSWRD